MTNLELRELNDNRQSEYPNLQDLLIAIAEKLEGDDSAWNILSSQRLEVKAKYPKPE